MIQLWQHFLRDDLDAFRQLVAAATIGVGSQKGLARNKPGSPALPSTSPKITVVKTRKSLESTNQSGRTVSKHDQNLQRGILTRAQINARDDFGRTLLHHVAVSSRSNALGFVEVLLQIPFVDLYIQDLESGWTPLHRALYHGHVRIAQAFILKDANDPDRYLRNPSQHAVGGLIKIKDHEGNTALDLFALTIAPRDLQHSSLPLPSLDLTDNCSVDSADLDGSDPASSASGSLLASRNNLLGDEVFAFGSNKNLNLGLGDQDDRQFPEQVTLNRPHQLLCRLYQDVQCVQARSYRGQASTPGQMIKDDATVPAFIAHRPIVIQEVAMSKFHTAVTTNDPVCNVYVCGYGPGGRLGTGDESTRFSYVCLESGGLSKKHVVAMALGQDHSIAVCEHGELFTWGSNRWGQLGYALPQSPSNAKEFPRQLTPRQLFGSMKNEFIIGAAASSLHSVIFTSSAVFTFGRNEGQLGLMDADARSLEIQNLPRKVGVSVLQSPVLSVTANDRATAVLLESRDVVVLTHYGWTKLVFQLVGFANPFLRSSAATRYSATGSKNSNFVSKITSGGNTICAVSAFGEVFAVDVSKKSGAPAKNQSTTNPFKARNALLEPSKLWSTAKSHMAARDVSIDQDGSIILCTAAGSVWRKEKRANVKRTNPQGANTRKGDYKFARIPNLGRAVGVRSNGYGAHTVIRRDYHVMREQIVVDPHTIWDTFFTMLPFRGLISPTVASSDSGRQAFRFWTSSTPISSPARVKKAILFCDDIESQVSTLLQEYQPLGESPYDMWITSTTSNIQIPVHSFLVKARSRVLRQALAEFQKSYFFSIPDVLSVEYGPDGHIHLRFEKVDFLTVLNYAFYLYTENVVDVWHHTQQRPGMAPRYRQTRLELIKIGNHVGMRNLEHAARVMIEPAKCLHVDMEMALGDPEFFADADVSILLANDVEMPAHRELLSHRCPFFKGLFDGRAGGIWLSSRRNESEGVSDVIRVDLKHVEEEVFAMVLRHMYADTSEELFDSVATTDLDEFLDVVLDVMAVSNELMLDRLAQVCQKKLGQHVNTRNVCQLLNAVAACSVDEFKRAGLEYICLNLETMLEQRLLEDLDADLLAELDEMTQENQLACLPFARSGRAEAQLLEEYPQLAAQIEQGKQRMVDSLRVRSQILHSEVRKESAERTRTVSEPSGSVSQSPFSTESTSGQMRPIETRKASGLREQGSEMVFEMDEDNLVGSPAGSTLENPSNARRLESEVGQHDVTPRPHDVPRLHNLAPTGNCLNAASVTSGGFSLHDSPSTSSVLGGRLGASVASSQGTALPDRPWHQSMAGSPKADLKCIMAQAADSKTSNLTLAINHKSVAKAAPKLSQRQRKKIQHQHSKGDAIGSAAEDDVATEPSVHSRTPTSPWRSIGKDLDSSNPQENFPSSYEACPDISRPAMTMRQTVAGGSAIPKTAPSGKSPSQLRSISMPGSGMPSTPTSQIQSIRHTPATAVVSCHPVSASYSMAAIVEQQQSEKSAIEEAVARRSLQEIQQEQEFQEWWEHESKKVQEQQSGTSVTGTTRGKAARSRGGNRNGGNPSRSDAGAGKTGDDRQSGRDGNAGAQSQGRRPRRGGRGSSRGH